MRSELHPRCKLPVSIYYEDTDCVGIVYHSNYLKYFERGREKLLGQDALVNLFEESGRNFVVVNVGVTFKLGARHGDILEVRTIPTIESAYRLEFDCSVWRKETSEEERWTPIVIGKVQMVCLDGEMKLCALPPVITDEMREIFGDLVKPGRKAPPRRRRLPAPRRSALSRSSASQGEAAAPHKFEIRVYYEDTDFTGVVYYANYLKFMERARSQLFGFRNLARMKRDDGLSFVVHSANLDFKEGATHGDLLVVRTTYVSESDFRVVFHQSIYRKSAALDASVEGEGAGSENNGSEGGGGGGGGGNGGGGDADCAGMTLLVKGTIVLVCVDEAGRLSKVPTPTL